MKPLNHDVDPDVNVVPTMLADLAGLGVTGIEISSRQLEAFRLQSGCEAPRADACTLCDTPDDTCTTCDASDWTHPDCVTCDEGDQACTYCDAPKDSCETCDMMDGDCGTGNDACMTCDEGDVCQIRDIR